MASIHTAAAESALATTLAPATASASASTLASTSTSTSTSPSHTPLWHISPTLPYTDLLTLVAPAAELLKQQHVVAFPTETVYGLGGSE